MPGPLPDNPAQRQRRNQSATKATLSLAVEHEIPPMPPSEDWLAERLDIQKGEFYVPKWGPHVVRWWNDIWSSPMSNEYDDADIHGLYLACLYLHESTCSTNKVSDRISYGKSYEAAVKNFGLTPMSRRSLQWEIARADEATKAAEAKERKRKANEPTAGLKAVEEPDPRYA